MVMHVSPARARVRATRHAPVVLTRVHCTRDRRTRRHTTFDTHTHVTNLKVASCSRTVQSSNVQRYEPNCRLHISMLDRIIHNYVALHRNALAAIANTVIHIAITNLKSLRTDGT